MLREFLERHQIWIYLASVLAGAAVAWAIAGTERLAAMVNPALALMLFVTFLQVPLRDIGKAFRNIRFVVALLVANFVVTPLLVFLGAFDSERWDYERALRGCRTPDFLAQRRTALVARKSRSIADFANQVVNAFWSLRIGLQEFCPGPMSPENKRRSGVLVSPRSISISTEADPNR